MEKPAAGPPLPARSQSRWVDDYPQRERLSASASNRLARLAHLEATREGPRVAHPDWLEGRPVPRLIVRARYTGTDAFGASRMMAQLDLATRRAWSAQRSLASDESLKDWPLPLRTYRGGLRLLDAQVGSLDLLMTVWGELVTIATSAPIAVASLLALSWDVTRGLAHLATRWRASPLARDQGGAPSLEPPASSANWGVKHTKELAPVLAQAVENDQGFEFFLADGEHELKIVVLPKQSNIP